MELKSDDLVSRCKEIFPLLTQNTIVEVVNRHKGDQESIWMDLEELNDNLKLQEDEQKEKERKSAEEEARQRHMEEEQRKIQELKNKNMDQLQQQKETIAKRIDENRKTPHRPFPEEGQNLSQSLTSSTLSNLQAQLNKVYEDSFLIMEQKIKEQVEEMDSLNEQLQSANNKMDDLEQEIQEVRKVLNVYKSAEIVNDIVEGIKNTIDESFLKASPGIDLSSLSVLIKRQLAKQFITDYKSFKDQNGKDLSMSFVYPSAPKTDGNVASAPVAEAKQVFGSKDRDESPSMAVPPANSWNPYSYPSFNQNYPPVQRPPVFNEPYRQYPPYQGNTTSGPFNVQQIFR